MLYLLASLATVSCGNVTLATCEVQTMRLLIDLHAAQQKCWAEHPRFCDGEELGVRVQRMDEVSSVAAKFCDYDLLFSKEKTDFQIHARVVSARTSDSRTPSFFIDRSGALRRAYGRSATRLDQQL